ncbi:hypothetical protein QBC43DRAFT_43853 [Cladorrhinum sp. PSN259]|nr:hypothetical protein QBC43DRAFT_43853 [Cladorrhinum sp. PSN259]
MPSMGSSSRSITMEEIALLPVLFWSAMPLAVMSSDREDIVRDWRGPTLHWTGITEWWAPNVDLKASAIAGEPGRARAVIQIQSGNGKDEWISCQHGNLYRVVQARASASVVRSLAALSIYILAAGVALLGTCTWWMAIPHPGGERLRLGCYAGLQRFWIA